MDGTVVEKKSSFIILGLTFSSKLYLGPYIISIAKTASKKIGPLIRSMKFLSSEVALCLCKLQYTHAWNTVVMPSLVLLLASFGPSFTFSLNS